MDKCAKSLENMTFNHSGLYKQKTSHSSLDERRTEFLLNQKRKRLDYMNLVRRLTEYDWTSDQEPMEYQSGDYHKPHRKPFHRDQLMYSEWMPEIPIDFEEEWLCVPCPVGKRCLVIASKGNTTAWSKFGSRLESFPSAFPGGSPYLYKDNTILDCLFSKNSGTFFILDMMCWRGNQLYDSESEFRFYWLKTKTEEYPEILEKSKNNQFNFVPLTHHPCNVEAIYCALANPVFSEPMDGVLFYHRRSHYTFGSTPLVGWLKPFMLSEIIDINLPESISALRPPSYVDYKTYIENFDEKYRQKMRQHGLFKYSDSLNEQRTSPSLENDLYEPDDMTIQTRKRNMKKRGSRNPAVPGLDNIDDEDNKMEQVIVDSQSSSSSVHLKPSLLGTDKKGTQ